MRDVRAPENERRDAHIRACVPFIPRHILLMAHARATAFRSSRDSSAGFQTRHNRVRVAPRRDRGAAPGRVRARKDCGFGREGPHIGHKVFPLPPPPIPSLLLPLPHNESIRLLYACACVVSFLCIVAAGPRLIENTHPPESRRGMRERS